MPADKPDDRVPGQMTPADREALKRRADELGAKLDTAKHRHEAPKARQGGAAAGRGMKAAAELIGGIVVGGVLGWYLDQWLGTKPWLFILFFLLGSAAGMLNIIRSASQEKTPPAPSVKDDPDQ